MESPTSYDKIKNNPKLLLLLVGKYVKVQLIQNLSASGFIHAIDPCDYSIILLEPNGKSFETIVLPGHAVVDVTEAEALSGVKPPVRRSDSTTSSVNSNNLQKKQRLMEWLKLNHLPVTECEKNIVIGNVMIMPPYDVINIYSTNLTVTKQVKNLMETMPNNCNGT